MIASLAKSSLIKKLVKVKSSCANVVSKVRRYASMKSFDWTKIGEEDLKKLTVIGVDLGTSQSSVAVMTSTGQSRIVQDLDGLRQVLSMVSVMEDGRPVVGSQAKMMLLTNHYNTFYATKRLLGRRFDEVAKKAKISPFLIVEGRGGQAWVEDCEGHQYSPSHLTAFLLAELKQNAEQYLGKRVDAAVIAVPALFNDVQRGAIKEAAQIAGINVLRIIHEPTAAALAFGHNLPIPKEEEGLTAVFDLGAGTFDVSLIHMREGVFQTHAIRGNAKLGGNDFNDVIVNYLLSEMEPELRLAVRSDMIALERVREAAEYAKVELSARTTTVINLPYLVDYVHFTTELSRSRLESLVRHLAERTMGPCKQVMSDAGAVPDDVRRVLLSGGMGRMPLIRETVESVFGKKPMHNLGDEAVARGAAVQGALITGRLMDPLLLDVTPASLGVEMSDGIGTVVGRQSYIPTCITQTYFAEDSDAERNGFNLLIHREEKASESSLLGTVLIPPEVRSRIDVAYSVDADGMASVSARDEERGVEYAMMRCGVATSEMEMKRMRSTVEAFEARGRGEQQQDWPEVLERIEQFMKYARRTINIFRAQLPPGDTRSVMKDLEALTRCVDELKSDEKQKHHPQLSQIRGEFREIQKKTLALFQKAAENIFEK